MNYRRKHHIRKWGSGLIGMVVLPLYGIVFSLKGPSGDLLLSTFSQIGSRYGGIEILIVWGIFAALYFFLSLSYLFDISQADSLLLRTMMIITCLSLLWTVYLPYQPLMFPVASDLHNLCAYLTALCAIITLLLFDWSLKKTDRKLFVQSIAILIVSVVILLALYLLYKVSSLLQIALTTIIAADMFLEFSLIENSPAMNLEAVMKSLYEKSENQNHDF